jgi:hypothetical protein
MYQTCIYYRMAPMGCTLPSVLAYTKGYDHTINPLATGR